MDRVYDCKEGKLQIFKVEIHHTQEVHLKQPRTHERNLIKIAGDIYTVVEGRRQKKLTLRPKKIYLNATKQRLIHCMGTRECVDMGKTINTSKQQVKDDKIQIGLEIKKLSGHRLKKWSMNSLNKQTRLAGLRS